MQSYFVSKENDRFILTENDFHHVKDVMRIKNNDNIICVYDGASYLCSFRYTKVSYEIDIIEKIDKQVELPKNVILYQAVIKNDKFDLVIQKACELGVSAIVPTVFERSVVKVNNDNSINKLGRYEKIAKEACEQSKRVVIPEIKDFISVKNIKLDSKTLGLLAYEANGDYASFNKALANLDEYDSIALVVGPEGGFAPSEVKYLESIGFKNVSLGKRILRSETASFYGLSVIAYKLEGEN